MDKERYARNLDGQQYSLTPPMSALSAILIYDRDTLFGEALQNFLFAAGFSSVDVATTLQEALGRLRCNHYTNILIDLSPRRSGQRRWSAVIQRRQPDANIIFLIKAADQPLIQEGAFDHVIKEYGFAALLELI
ncbi:MAG TPA: response regulator [Candidatus Binatia bacterium]|nr:response regulator [Candidatus Binatia bacterium]